MEWYITLLIIGMIYYTIKAFIEKNPTLMKKGGGTWQKIKDWINR